MFSCDTCADHPLSDFATFRSRYVNRCSAVDIDCKLNYTLYATTCLSFAAVGTFLTYAVDCCGAAVSFLRSTICDTSFSKIPQTSLAPLSLYQGTERFSIGFYSSTSLLLDRMHNLIGRSSRQLETNLCSRPVVLLRHRFRGLSCSCVTGCLLFQQCAVSFVSCADGYFGLQCLC